MRDLRNRLEALPAPSRVAVIGIGSIGKGLVYQSTITPSIECVAIADVQLGKAVATAEAFRLPYRVVRAPGELHDAVRQGHLAVCEDGDLVARCEAAQVVIEASSALAPAARYALAAVEHGKHVVVMNAHDVDHPANRLVAPDPSAIRPSPPRPTRE
jgi:predicted homoserine dehydrogenase-like protein